MEISNNDLENQDNKKNNKETIDVLANFWKNSDNDKKFLENPKAWENAVNAIKWDINEKTKSIKSPENRAKIDEKLKWLEKYSKLWKLNTTQAQELSSAYKEIASIQWTEVKQDNIQGEQAKNSREKQEQDYVKKLLDAVEKFDKLLASHSEEAQNKLKSDSEKMELARSKQKEPESAYENLEIPTSQKESPKA